LLSQKKETKEKATPLPLVSFGLSAASGRLRNSAFSLRQSSLKPSQLFNASQARQQGIESQNHTNAVIPSLTRNPVAFAFLQ
jgi:hypothetical protein